MKFQTFSIVAGTMACDAACPFCVAAMTEANGLGAKEPIINWRNFDKACRLAEKAGVTTAMITGKGEPTLFPDQVSAYLKAMQQHNFPILEIQSNGLRAGRGLLEKNGKDYLQEWYDLGLNTYAISVVHHKKEFNKKVYTPKSDYIDLPATIAKLNKIGYAVRLAVVLVKDMLDTPEALDEMIRFARENNVAQLTFRPVNQTDKPHSNDRRDLEIYRWTGNNRIAKEQVQVLEQHIAKRGEPLMHLNHGATIYDVDGQNVCMTNSLTLSTNNEELRQLIYFPNGQLYYDWQYRGARIM